jgi:tetratricopeptide (TPR) repeat protein
VMSIAPLNGIAITSDVRRKVRAIFELSSLGQVTLEGQSDPVPVLSIAGLRAMPEPLAGLQGLQSPLVGREVEWSRLLASVDRLLSHQGQVFWLTGDAGLGKSRLVAELREYTAGGRFPSVRWVEGRCHSYTQPVSYWPFIEVVQQVVGIDASDAKVERWEKLHDAVAELLPPREAGEILPHLANFMNLPLEGFEHLLQLDAETLQRQTFAAVRALLEAYARRPPAPLVLVLEDIHWMDQASLSLLEYLLPVINHVPVLLLLTCRAWHSRSCQQMRERLEAKFPSRMARIELRPLTLEDSVQLLGNLVPLARWPPEMCELIFDRTEGNPLYLEEVTHALLDTQVLAQDSAGRWYVNGGLDPSGVPDTLEGAMVARLERLEEPCRRAAQIAAVVGRTFHFDVLAHLWSGDHEQLIQQVGELQQRAIIRQVERMPEPIYSFKHALLQEVCYDSLPVDDRIAYHRQIAAYLEGERSVGRVEMEGNYPLIAYHAFAGQDWSRALRYQALSGQRAKALYANREAVEHLEKALHSADNLRSGEGAEERQGVHVALGEVLTVTGQYERAVDHLRRANALAAERGDCDAQAHTCRLLARLYENRGEYALALSWIREGMMAVQSSGRPGCMDVTEVAQFRLLAGLINMRQGHYEAALDQGQRGLVLAQELGEVAVQAQANNLLGNTHRLLGHSGTAVEHLERALDLYRQVGDVRGQAISHNQIATAHFYTGQWQRADRSYRQAYDMFSQIGDVYNCAGASNNLGGIALNQGRLDEALRFYRSGLRAVEQIGGSLYLIGLFHNNIGATYIRAGDEASARRHLRTSQEYFEAAQARDFLPELHRHLAELALRCGSLSQAEQEGQQAFELARELSMSGEEGSVLRVLGEIAAARSDLDQAEEYLHQSLSILERVGDEYERARSQLALAQAYAAAGRPEAASAVLDGCVSVFERLGARLDLAAARSLQGGTGTSAAAT